jgi:hypothetical protein
MTDGVYWIYTYRGFLSIVVVEVEVEVEGGGDGRLP